MDVPFMLWNVTRHLIFWLILGGSLAAGTIEPGVPDYKYREFAKQFPFVVRIRTHKRIDEKTVQLGYASAVIIKPHWIVTAAHVVDDGVQGAYVFKTSKDEGGYELDTCTIHKDFKSDAPGGFHDIALCHSARDFDLEFYTPLYRKTDETKKISTISGWGIPGNFITGHSESDSYQRAGRNRIDAAEDGFLVCSPSRRQTDNVALEFMISPGDSGGGLFIGNELAGVASLIRAPKHISPPSSRYGEEAVFTRISLYADWIDQHTQARPDDQAAPVPKKPLPPQHRDADGRPVAGPVHQPEHPSTKPWWERRK